MTSRRKFLSSAAATVASAGAGAAAVAAPALNAPMINFGAPLKLKFQSTFPKEEMRHGFAQMLVDNLNAMAGGRLEIELFATGKESPVKANDVLDAVSSGKLDGGLGYPAYWYNKAPATGLWDAGPAFGMNSQLLLSWHRLGGGQQLLDEIYKGLGAKVQSIVCVPLATQPLGWFKKPITSPADFRGMKFRTVGLAQDVYSRLGATVTPVPGGQIIAALKGGTLDAAEWNNTTSDRQIGLDKLAAVCMLQSFHEATGVLEFLIADSVMQQMSPDLQRIVRVAVDSLSSEGYWRQVQLNADSYEDMTREGTRFYKTPSLVLQAQLNVWDQILAEKSAKDPQFAKVAQSQREYARKVVRWQQDIEVDYRLAYDHYWSRRV